jgi:hypothetical protein
LLLAKHVPISLALRFRGSYNVAVVVGGVDGEYTEGFCRSLMTAEEVFCYNNQLPRGIFLPPFHPDREMAGRVVIW